MDLQKLEERVEKNKQKVAKAQKEAQLAEKALKEEKRKVRSRRLIVLGAHAEMLCGSDPDFKNKLYSFVDRVEKKDVNRRLFEFLPENQTEQNAPIDKAVAENTKFS